jgi:putative oxidoreductase
MAMVGSWGSVPLHASRLPVRLALGSTMLYHGVSKLRGDGPMQTAQFFEQIGIRPAKGWAIATGVTETLAGALAVLGIATRPAAVAVLVTQAVAVARVHGPKGFDVAKGGYEYNLLLMAVATALLVGGPGRLSAHEALERAVDRRARRSWWSRGRRPLARAVRLLK